MRAVAAYEVRWLVLDGGCCPFREWFDELSEEEQLTVDDRLSRVRQGSFGEVRFVGEGVWELKFREGRGLRVYYGQIGRQIILLLAGGDKRTQSRDIVRARKLFRNYKSWSKGK